MSLLSSSEQNYSTWEEFVAVVETHVEVNDYHVVKRRFKKNEKTDLLKKFRLICDRSRDFRIKEIKKRKRDINSTKCDCLFAITTIYYKSREIWSLNVLNDTHNHEELEDDELSIVSIYKTKKFTEKKLIEIDNAIKQDE